MILKKEIAVGMFRYMISLILQHLIKAKPWSDYSEKKGGGGG